MNVKITIAYDGTCYEGSQRQPNGLSMENQLIEVFKALNIEPNITLSGRTDKDVHATGQVFNIEIPNFWTDLKKLKTILNRHLPFSIQIRHIQKVHQDFHARFCAKKRVYRYLVTTQKTTPFNAKYITYSAIINETLIKEAINCFVGVHDFEYFHKTGSDKHQLVREIFDATFYKYKDVYVFKFVANSYLRSQIRLMVGFLLAISNGKRSIEELKAQLNKQSRVHRLPAPPYGLYLAKVIY
jgi:tRNA pseudouridine38-40 synthase